MSLLTPDILWLLGEFHSNAMTEKCGGSMYGPDSRRWPAWWADAMETLTAERMHTNALIGIRE